MNFQNICLTPVDWRAAQKLLSELVRVLSPLTARAMQASVVLNCRPLADSREDSFSQHAFTRLLPSLHAVQKEVAKLIAEPEAEERAKEPCKEGVVKVVNKNLAKEKPVDPAVGKKEVPFKAVSPSETAKPLVAIASEEPAALAKELIHQVQKAIGLLSSSTHVQDPKEAPFMKTLKELKPKLDRIIEALAESKPVDKKGAAPQLRPAVPIPARSERISKQLFSPPSSRELPKSSEKLNQTRTPAEQILKLPARKREVTLEKRGGGEELLPPAMKRSKEEHAVQVNVHSEKIEKRENVPTREPRPVALPAAPLLFEPKRLALSAKKKKRKGFWFKEEDPSQEEP